MSNLKKLFGSDTAKAIAVQGVAIPAIGVLVQYGVSKLLVKAEQKNTSKEQSAVSEHAVGEEFSIKEFGD